MDHPRRDELRPAHSHRYAEAGGGHVPYCPNPADPVLDRAANILAPLGQGGGGGGSGGGGVGGSVSPVSPGFLEPIDDDVSVVVGADGGSSSSFASQSAEFVSTAEAHRRRTTQAVADFLQGGVAPDVRSQLTSVGAMLYTAADTSSQQLGNTLYGSCCTHRLLVWSCVHECVGRWVLLVTTAIAVRVCVRACVISCARAF